MSDEIDAAAQARFDKVAEGVERRLRGGRRVLSFAEFLSLFEENPLRYSRDASRYVYDAFLHYGVSKRSYPWGESTRYNLFDLPWEVRGPKGPPRGVLVGQEEVQDEVFRALANFAREGRPNRLVLLHGPNGSAKSTIVGCIMAALENYSMLDEGALYRFNWLFPSSRTVRGSLGFGSEGTTPRLPSSFAHLPEDQIDAKLLVEVRDHPLFLIPIPERTRLLEEAYDGARKEAEAEGGAGTRVDPPNEWLLRGELSHKSQQVFEALLSSYDGSYVNVLKHVQVERYFISRRYRVGAVTIGPQMSVDAGERQLTADRSLQSLPASLQAMTLYEAKGELIDASGGVLEYSDLLKRPLDAFKYLQLSVETSEVALTQQNVQLNCVMMGSANELHLDAFKDHAEFPSFRGRMELLRVPYLRSYVQEQAIYDGLIGSQARRHVAPHAIEMAAIFAVLTRMRKPDPSKYGKQLGSIVATLTPFEKADLYSIGKAPERLDADAQKLLRSHVREVWEESVSYPIYEGRIGASPREMRATILDAAQSEKYKCLSPLGVLDEIRVLCRRKNEFEWLQQGAISGGYHDVDDFLVVLDDRLVRAWETELYASSGFVDDAQFAELFDRYVQHVSVLIKSERVYNRATQRYEEPDEKMMTEVERMLLVKGDATDWRRQLISAIAAWSLDHPGQKFLPGEVFPQHIKKMRDSIYTEKRRAVAVLARDMVGLVRDETEADQLQAQKRADAEAALARMVNQFGYCRECATDAVSMVLRKRFQDIPV